MGKKRQKVMRRYDEGSRLVGARYRDHRHVESIKCTRLTDRDSRTLLQEEEQNAGAEEGQANGGHEIVYSGNVPNKMPAEQNKERETTPYMTKYERARILGTRALQIS